MGGCIETTPGLTASVHFYTATANIISAAELSGHSAYVDDVVVNPLLVKDGCLPVPKGPGLGMVIDEEKVARYQVNY